MKKNISAQEIIEHHIKYDLIIEKASETMDYKTNNKAFKQRDKYFTVLEKNLDMAKEVYGYLIHYDCVETQMSSSAECLKLGIYIDEAEQILEKISARDDIGILSFDAEMVLRVWRGEVPGSKL